MVSPKDMIDVGVLTLDILNERQARIKPVRRGLPPNCIGTLLYFIGERDEDSFAWIQHINDLIVWKDSPYDFTEVPQALDLAFWHDPSNYTNTLHAGIVVDIKDTPIIRSRLGCGNWKPIRDLSPSDVENALRDIGYTGPTHLKYYTLRTKTSFPPSEVFS